MTTSSSEWAQYTDAVLARLDFAKVFAGVQNQKSSGAGCIAGLCPFHDDSKPSFGVDLKTGAWQCFAGCGKGGAIDFVMRQSGRTFKDVVLALGAEMGVAPPGGCGDNHDIVYPYRDESGTLLFEIVRGPRKKFRQRRPDGRGGHVWSAKGVRRVLYRLPELIARPAEVVYVVEGEKCADRLNCEGRLATTAPCGSNAQWLSEYSASLQGRVVVAIPDNDKPGRAHMEKAARSLSGVAASVRVVDLPGLPDKGDIVDFFNAGHTLDELDALVAAAPVWVLTSSQSSNIQPSAAATAGGTFAKQVIDLAIAANVTLFHDEDKEPFAAIPVAGGRRTVALASRECERWLGELVWRKLQKPLSADTLTAVINVLGSIARYDGATVPLSVRAARHEGEIWLDVDGIRALRVLPGRWEFVPEPPLRFRSFPSQQALPAPRPGGNLRDLLRFVNLARSEDVLLLLCYLVVALVPGIPIPILIVHGPQGAAKTTLLKLLKFLLDPFKVALIGSIQSVEDFVIAAHQNRVLYFDNLSGLTPWQSDLLCRAVTGDGHMKRTLYTNSEATTFQFQRVVGLSGINNVADKPDLLDRAVLLQLAAVPTSERKREETFWAEFQTCAPDIFGGLLDVLAKTMAIAPTISLSNHPRMADFAHWGSAAAIALGSDAETFAAAYAANVGRQNEAAIDSSPVAQAILVLMKDCDQWEGSAGELHARLNQVAGQERIDTRSKQWPASASWVTRRLREIEANLLSMGISCDTVRAPGRRCICIKKTGGQVINELASAPQGQMTACPQAPLAVMDAVICNTWKNMADDSNDSNDSKSRTVGGDGQARPGPDWSEDQLEEWEERAAIMEYDGGLFRSDAEARAAEQTSTRRSHVIAIN